MTKYIGPKTDGENVATQADKLSLSSETPDALTPDQTGAAGTATTAARSDHQHEILAAAAGTITGTNAEGSSTSFARADHNHAYGALSIPNSALALGPTYETSLPGSPVDGQEIYYAADASNGVIWHLRYRSGATGSYKWEFIGGSSMSTDSFAETSPGASMTADAWSDISSAISITAPLEGDYFVTASSSLLSQTNSAAFWIAVKKGSTEEALSAITKNSTDSWQNGGVSGKLTGVGASGASKVIALRYKSNLTQSSSVFRRGASLEITPIRVG